MKNKNVLRLLCAITAAALPLSGIGTVLAQDEIAQRMNEGGTPFLSNEQAMDTSDGTTAEKPLVPETTPPEAPEVPEEKPEVPTEKPEVPTEKPEIPSEKPAVPAEKPEVPIEDTPETVPEDTPKEAPVEETPMEEAPLEEEVQPSVPDLTSMPAPAIHAGKAFYIDELEKQYHLTFSKDFETVIDEIETEYRTKHNLKVEENVYDEKVSNALLDAANMDKNNSRSKAAQTEITADTRQNTLKGRNWQDILAVYVMQQSKQGKTEYVMNADSKKELSIIFAGMNLLKEKDGQKVYDNMHVAQYIENHKSALSEKDISLLKKLTSSDCRLLCAVVTGTEEFIMESLGENVSEERAQVVAAAYSLVGKVSYFWGGKSFSFGWDDRWGQASLISAAGSDDSGQIKNFGLDCSGYVSWVFANGYGETAAGEWVGQGTASQWSKSQEIEESEAIPGDLVFLQPPSSSGINHVGIVVGRSESGDLIAAHCNASDNGVVVEAAHSAGFRYVKRPNCLEKSDLKTRLK